MKTVLIELPFAGPVGYYREILASDHVIFEQWEHFEKATYRNRCHIAGPDGLQRLTIPILHGRSHRQRVKDARIAYAEDWRKQHWKSLEAAYRRSPYFEFYEEPLEALYRSRPEFLLEFNLRVHDFIVKALGISMQAPDAEHSDPLSGTDPSATGTGRRITCAFSTQYEEQPAATDMRSRFVPGKDAIHSIRYHQVFEDRHGFIPNLSVLDLLFNEGPHGALLLV